MGFVYVSTCKRLEAIDWYLPRVCQINERPAVGRKDDALVRNFKSATFLFCGPSCLLYENMTGMWRKAFSDRWIAVDEIRGRVIL